MCSSSSISTLGARVPRAGQRSGARAAKAAAGLAGCARAWAPGPRSERRRERESECRRARRAHASKGPHLPRAAGACGWRLRICARSANRGQAPGDGLRRASAPRASSAPARSSGMTPAAGRLTLVRSRALSSRCRSRYRRRAPLPPREFAARELRPWRMASRPTLSGSRARAHMYAIGVDPATESAVARLQSSTRPGTARPCASAPRRAGSAAAAETTPPP